jgi:hypothetical protein
MPNFHSSKFGANLKIMENFICILKGYYIMLELELLSFFAVGIYFAILLLLAFILSPKRRRHFKGKSGYENNLHILVIFRQVFLFFLPLMLSITFLGVAFTLEQLLSLLVLGLSINVFWIIQLPLLTRAQLFVDFSVDQLNDFDTNIILTPKTKHVIYGRIYNLGFSTLKNGTVLIYFGDQFEKSKCNIIPSDKEEYSNLEFRRRFGIQKAHAGVSFSPKENFLTMPPQEWFIFPIIVEISDCELDSNIEVQFYSENSWGVTKYHAQIKTQNSKAC